ncbi:MAG: sigma-54-dependent Fis family transcriptional regulator [Candidatus Riflebacteria bacterium]|nr:sigma-54-dependent Fis family transcriptional regulator [Candidatus Riflebacteria bacterium]
MVMANGHQGKVLVVEDEKKLWGVLQRLFSDEGWEFTFASSAEEAMDTLGQPGQLDDLAVVLVDIGLPGASGLDFLRWIRGIDVNLPVVMLTGQADAKTAATYMKEGAADYVTKPFQSRDLASTVHRVVEASRRVRPSPGLFLDHQLSFLMGPSEKVRQLTRLLIKVSSTDMAVLIKGESGTGKEILSRRIHDLSGRCRGPFIAVDCGAIPDSLIESELFGFKKGSFTGAHADQHGKIRAAHGGTLFLDEVENLAQATQVKLLRCLQEREVTPIGATRPVPFDIRLVSATNISLGERIAKKEFRLDLFHRIAEFPLSIPPLRERPTDLLYLAARFLRESCEEFGKCLKPLDQTVLDELLRHRWPGNVRELRNAIRRAVLVSQERITTLSMERTEMDGIRDPVPVCTEDQIVVSARASVSAEAIKQGRVPFKEIRNRVLAQIEQGILKAVLERLSGNKLQTARVLGLDYKTVHSKAKAIFEGRGIHGEEKE